MSDDTGGDRGRDAEAPQDIPAKGFKGCVLARRQGDHG